MHHVGQKHVCVCMCNLYFTHSIQLLDNTCAVKQKVLGGGWVFQSIFSKLCLIVTTVRHQVGLHLSCISPSVDCLFPFAKTDNMCWLSSK